MWDTVKRWAVVGATLGLGPGIITACEDNSGYTVLDWIFIVPVTIVICCCGTTACFLFFMGILKLIKIIVENCWNLEDVTKRTEFNDDEEAKMMLERIIVELKATDYESLDQPLQKNKQERSLVIDCSDMSELDFAKAKIFVEGFNAMYEETYKVDGRTLHMNLPENDAFWPMDHFESSETAVVKLTKFSDRQMIVEALSQHVKTISVDVTMLANEEELEKTYEFIMGISKAIGATTVRNDATVDIELWKKPLLGEGKKAFFEMQEKHDKALALMDDDLETNFSEISSLYEDLISLGFKFRIMSRYELEYIAVLVKFGTPDTLSKAVRVFSDFYKRYEGYGYGVFDIFFQCNRLLRETYQRTAMTKVAISIYEKLLKFMVEENETKYLSFLQNCLIQALLKAGRYGEAENVAAAVCTEDEKSRLISEILMVEVLHEKADEEMAVLQAKKCSEKLNLTDPVEERIHYELEEFIKACECKGE